MSNLERLIAWLEKQPLETAYDFAHPWDCLLAQWLRAEGCRRCSIRSAREIKELYGEEIYHVAKYGQTFGGALEQARYFRANSE